MQGLLYTANHTHMYLTSYLTTLHQVTSHNITSHQITSYLITLHHITSHHNTAHHAPPYHNFISFHFTPCHIVTLNIIFTSKSHHNISNRIISHLIMRDGNAPHLIVSQHLTSYGGEGYLVDINIALNVVARSIYIYIIIGLFLCTLETKYKHCGTNSI